MNNFTIILPIYNDWHSLGVLLDQIKGSIRKKKAIIKLFLINDGSTEKEKLKFDRKFYKGMEILYLKKNIGSQKAIATGLKYLNKNKKKYQNNFIIMDSDGEDDPKKINDIIKIVEKNNNTDLITLNRTIRKESFFFSILYEFHLFITFLTTFKYIRFGNFTYLNKKSLQKISKEKDLWLAYSATVRKFITKSHTIIANRKKRISGKSKMSYLNLIRHSINIQNVFKKNVLIAHIFYSSIMVIFSFIGLPIEYVFLIINFFVLHLLFIVLFSQKKVNGITFNTCLNNIKSLKKL